MTAWTSGGIIINMNQQWIAWTIIGGIFAAGIVYLCAIGKVSTEVVTALAGVAVTAIFEERSKANAVRSAIATTKIECLNEKRGV